MLSLSFTSSWPNAKPASSPPDGLQNTCDSVKWPFGFPGREWEEEKK